MSLKLIVFAAACLMLSLSACTESSAPHTEPEMANTPINLPIKTMENAISIIEIATTDLDRAIQFYQAILDVQIERADMGEVQMGILPCPEGTVSVVLAMGPDYQPSASSSILYLNGGQDLQAILDRIPPSGGTVLVPKTEISPEMGYFALFIDSEGNRMGLHSPA